MWFSREVTLTLVFDLLNVSICVIIRGAWTHCGQPASGALDVIRLGQLNVWRTIPEPINTKTGKGDQILLSLAGRK